MKTLIRNLALLFIFFFLGSNYLFAQRNYATTQQTGAIATLCANCIVTNPNRAVDGNLQTFSVLNVTVALDLSGNGSQTYEELIFPSPVVASGTQVRVKLGTGDGLLSLQALGGIFLRPYNGANPAGPAVAASSLITALNNNDQFEVGLTPAQPYDRIRVTLNGGILGALANLYVYDAYYNGPAAVACSSAADELHGISSALLGLGLGVGGVVNPQLAIDGNINTASTLNAGVGLAGAFAQQTVIYNAPSVAGDSLKLTLSIPQGLIDAGVLSNISVSTANGNINNNDTRLLNSSLLTVRLLDLTNNRRKVTVTFVPQNIFDRVQLRLGGGIAAVLSTLDFYEAQKLIPKPVVAFNGGSANNVQICSGTTATLAATPVANTVFNWYNVPTGGTPLFTGNNFTTPALTTATTYYVEAMRNGCTDASQRVPVTINILPLPVKPVVTNASVNICAGQTATFNATPVQGITINWYNAATGGTLLFSGNAFTTTALTATTSYYAEAVNANSCVSNGRLQVTAVVTPLPVTPVTSLASATINPGQTNTITISNAQPGVTYEFYAAANGGTMLATGTSFTTPALNTTTTYYISAVSGACTIPARIAVTITVNAAPDVTVTPPSQTVNSGQTAAFTASSSVSGATFNWYTTPTGGTPIFTGANFTTPPVTAGKIYYAEAVNPATGAVSSMRATATVNLNHIPDVTVTPQNQSVNSGQTATINATSTTANASFNWYTALTGGSPIFSGATFTTPPITGTTIYYAEAVDPLTNAVSTPRASGTITVNTGPNPAPDVTVTPQVQTVNSGQTANLTASSTVPNATFNWYTAPSGGSPVFTGATFTTPPVTVNTTYYAEAVNPATNMVSTTRASGTININPAPDVIVNPPTQNVNAGQTAIFTASSSTPGATFNWYTTATGGAPVFTGAAFTTPPVNANTIYYAEAVDPNTGAVSSPRATGTVNLNNGPNITVTPPAQNINAGQTATFTASSTTPNAAFQWFTTQTGGTPVFTGAVFTTPPVTANTIFYAEAIDPGTGAISSTRASGTVNINAAPSITVTPPAQSVNSGQTATFTASSTTPGATFNWYNAPAGGTPIFTGATFTTPPVTANTTYYAEAVDPATNAVSSPRATGVVNVVGIPDITVTPQTQSVNSGQVATFTASSTIQNATFNWYTTPTGGTPVFTGATFTTPPVTANTTYYAEAVDPSTGAVSSPRATGMVTINAAPSVAVTPPAQNVNSGQTATFTATSTVPGATFNWYTAPTGGTPIFTGATFTTPPVTANTTYYAEAVDPSTGAVSSPRATGMVTINAAPSVAVTPPAQNVNSGQTATFTASSTTPGATFNWYTAPTGGTPIFTGAAFTTPPVTANTTYYAEAIDPSTGAVSSPRATGMVTVNAAPSVAVTPPAQNVNSGQTATFTATSTVPGATFNWYTAPTGGTPIFTGAAFTTPPVTANTTYYAEAVDPSTGAVSSSRATGMVTVNANPPVAVTPPTQNVAPGLTATFTASSTAPGATFKWYTTPTGGTPIFTGATFTTPPITATTTFYAEAVDPSGAVSSTRATGIAMLAVPVPNIVVTPPIRTILTGNSTKFTATSATAGATFNWYTTPTGGTPIFTGAVFTTPAINANTIYYAEATSPAGGVSARAAATVNVLPASAMPTVAVIPPERIILSGQTATFTASSNTPGAIFNWYSAASSESAVFTGPVFTTPPLTANTQYWVEAIDPVTNAISITRALATVTISTNAEIYIPSAFSPNGDGRNDQLNVYGSTIAQSSLYVYDQWGQMLFHSENVTNGWDGTYKGVNQPVGVYVYYIKVTLTDNSTISKKGTITLIR